MPLHLYHLCLMRYCDMAQFRMFCRWLSSLASFGTRQHRARKPRFTFQLHCDVEWKEGQAISNRMTVCAVLQSVTTVALTSLPVGCMLCAGGLEHPLIFSTCLTGQHPQVGCLCHGGQQRRQSAWNRGGPLSPLAITERRALFGVMIFPIQLNSHGTSYPAAQWMRQCRCLLRRVGVAGHCVDGRCLILSTLLCASCDCPGRGPPQSPCKLQASQGERCVRLPGLLTLKFHASQGDTPLT